jgi:hypothetical protein
LLESEEAAATRRAVGLLDKAMKVSPDLAVVRYGAAAIARTALPLAEAAGDEQLIRRIRERYTRPAKVNGQVEHQSNDE